LVNAQEIPDREQVLFLNTEFKNARVNMANDSHFYAPMNFFFLVDQFARYATDGQYNILIWNDNIKNVIFGDSVFVKKHDVIVQELPQAPGLYVQYVKSVKVPGPTGGYGAPAPTANIPTINPMDFYKGNMRLGELDVSKLNVGNLYHKYWMEKDGKFVSFRTSKELQKLYPAFKKEIKKYIKESDVDFNNSANIIKLYNYVNSL